MSPGTKSSGWWARSQAAASSKPGQLAALDPLEERGPAVDLALVEAVGPAEVLRGPWPASRPSTAGRCPRPAGRPGPGRASRSVSNGAGQSPTCPSATSRRRSPSGRRCGPAPTGRRRRRWPAVCGTSVPPRASMIRHSRRMPVVARRRAPSAAGCAARRAGRPAGSRRSRSACRRRRTRSRAARPCPGRPCVVHPGRRAGRRRSQVPHLVLEVLGVLLPGRGQPLRAGAAVGQRSSLAV